VGFAPYRTLLCVTKRGIRRVIWLWIVSVAMRGFDCSDSATTVLVISCESNCVFSLYV
jgi:hypothetical protein